MTVETKKKENKMSRMWILALVMGVVGCLGFASCGSDEEENPGITYPIELLGAWQGDTRMEAVADENGFSTPEQVTETSIEKERIAINPNGTLVGYEQLDNGTWREASRGFWIYADGKLLVSGRSGDVVYKILTLDGVALVVSQSEQFTDDDGKKFTRTITSHYSRLTVE